jgi:hypothetical protein
MLRLGQYEARGATGLDFYEKFFEWKKELIVNQCFDVPHGNNVAININGC